MTLSTYRIPLYRGLEYKDRTTLSAWTQSVLDGTHHNRSRQELAEVLLGEYLATPERVILVTNSFCASLLVGEVLGITASSEVLAPSMASYRALHPLLMLGAKPRLVDSESSSWNIDPQAVEQALERLSSSHPMQALPRAIWVTHNYGTAAEMDALVSVGMRYRVPVVEYVGSSLGALYNHKRCGSMGTYSIIPFAGDRIEDAELGAAIVAPTPEEARRIRFLASGAHEKAPFVQYIRRGYDYTISPFLAQKIVERIVLLEDEKATAHKRKALYQELLRPIAGVRLLAPLPDSHWEGNDSRTVLLIDKNWLNFSNQELIVRLEKEGIQSQRLYRPMHMQPLYEAMPCEAQALSEELFERGVVLPSGAGLTEVEIHEVASIIRSLVIKYNS